MPGSKAYGQGPWYEPIIARVGGGYQSSTIPDLKLKLEIVRAMLFVPNENWSDRAIASVVYNEPSGDTVDSFFNKIKNQGVILPENIAAALASLINMFADDSGFDSIEKTGKTRDEFVLKFPEGDWPPHIFASDFLLDPARFTAKLVPSVAGVASILAQQGRKHSEHDLLSKAHDAFINTIRGALDEASKSNPPLKICHSVDQDKAKREASNYIEKLISENNRFIGLYIPHEEPPIPLKIGHWATVIAPGPSVSTNITWLTVRNPKPDTQANTGQWFWECKWDDLVRRRPVTQCEVGRPTMCPDPPDRVQPETGLFTVYAIVGTDSAREPGRSKAAAVHGWDTDTYRLLTSPPGGLQVHRVRYEVKA